MTTARLLLAVALNLALLSCGGGGDGGGGTPAPLTGVLIDSPVQGLPYVAQPSGLSERTGPNGEFQYQPGDFISFTTGALLSQVDAEPVVTPFTLLGRTVVADVNHEWPVNFARILMALDTTPGLDVLTMPATLPPLPMNIFHSLDSASFETALAPTGIPIVPRADAVAHLKKQFAIWGSWAISNTATELQVITFLPNGTYLFAHDDDPAVAGGNDGMERGTYRWNANTNAFTYTVAVNTDGTGGLSHPGPTQTPPYTFVVDASGNSAVLHLGPNVTDEIHLTRVADPTNSIVGTWSLTLPFGVEFDAVITFFTDGTFAVANDGADGVAAGIERGTYVFDGTTKTLTTSTTVDTNGDFGFNAGPTPSPPATITAVLESTLTPDLDYLRITEGGELVMFHRVKVP